MPESGSSKCDRIRCARESVGMSTEQVRQMLQETFGVTTPKQLSSSQCDELIVQLQGTVVA